MSTKQYHDDLKREISNESRISNQDVNELSNEAALKELLDLDRKFAKFSAPVLALTTEARKIWIMHCAHRRSLVLDTILERMKR